MPGTEGVSFVLGLSLRVPTSLSPDVTGLGTQSKWTPNRNHQDAGRSDSDRPVASGSLLSPKASSTNISRRNAGTPSFALSCLPADACTASTFAFWSPRYRRAIPGSPAQQASIRLLNAHRANGLPLRVTSKRSDQGSPLFPTDLFKRVASLGGIKDGARNERQSNEYEDEDEYYEEDEELDEEYEYETEEDEDLRRRATGTVVNGANGVVSRNGSGANGAKPVTGVAGQSATGAASPSPAGAATATAQRTVGSEPPPGIPDPSKISPKHSFLVLRPQQYEQKAANAAVSALREGKCVIVNMTMMAPEDASLFFNFISGACLALNRRTQLLGEKILLFGPPEVEIIEKY